MRTGAQIVRARPFSRTRSCFHIVTCIVEIKHGKTRYSMSIYLTTTTKIQTHQGVTMRTRAETYMCRCFLSRTAIFS